MDINSKIFLINIIYLYCSLGRLLFSYNGAKILKIKNDQRLKYEKWSFNLNGFLYVS